MTSQSIRDESGALNPSPAMQPLLEKIRIALHHNTELALQLCKQGLSDARQRHDDAAFLEISQSYGFIMDQVGMLLSAIDVLFEALQIAQSSRSIAAESGLMQLIARAFYTDGDYRLALQYWAYCAEIAEPAGETINWIYAKIGIGQIYDALGDHASAVSMHWAAAEKVEGVGDPYLTTKVLINLGRNLTMSGEYAAAEPVYARALALCEQHGFLDYEGETRFRQAELLIDMHHYAEAEAMLEAALDNSQRAKHQWSLANVLACQARLLSQQGRHQAALEKSQAAQRVAENIGTAFLQIKFHFKTSEYAEAVGNAPLALKELRLGLALQEQERQAGDRPNKRELEDQAGLRPSPSRLLGELSTDRIFDHGELDLALETLMRAACRILDVSRTSIWFATNNDSLICPKRYNAAEDRFDNPTTLTRQDLPVFFAWFDEHLPLVAHDALHHRYTRQLMNERFALDDVRSLLIYPVRLDTQTVALLFCEQIGRQRNWTGEEKLFGSQLTEIAARAFASHERHRYQEEIKQLNASLKSANEVLEARIGKRTAELEQAMQRLVQSEKLASLGNLVAGIAHELNTPLGVTLVTATAFRSQVDLLNQAFSDNTLRKSQLVEFIAASQEAGDLIERNTRRASELVRNFKQVAVDTTSALRRRFNLHATVEEVLATLTPILKHTPHRIHTKIAKTWQLDSFPGPLEQILNNLILNSVTHGFSDTQPGDMTISAEPLDKGRVRIIYEDNGRGIPPQHQRRIFDPFFTTRMGSGGSGLGLYIVYNLCCNVLGGDIVIDGKHSPGVRFVLDLPLHAPDTPKIRQAHTSSTGK